MSQSYYTHITFHLGKPITYINMKNNVIGNKISTTRRFLIRDAELGRADTVKEKGFFILPSELFVNVRKAKP